MENQKEVTGKELYRVYDEMACEDIKLTSNLQEAHNVAYNHQCVLIDNIEGKVLKDYSC